LWQWEQKNRKEENRREREVTMALVVTGFMQSVEDTEDESNDVERVQPDDAKPEEVQCGPAGIQLLLVGQVQDKAAEDEEEVYGEVATREDLTAKHSVEVEVHDGEGRDSAQSVERHEFVLLGLAQGGGDSFANRSDGALVRRQTTGIWGECSMQCTKGGCPALACYLGRYRRWERWLRLAV
jgi:hypothetical protein